MSPKFNVFCLKGTILLFFLQFLQVSHAQYDFSSVDAALANRSKLFGKNVVALIFKDGKVVYKKEIGEDFTSKTQAPIASCSKWLTAAMVMTFVDEGKLRLDDKVSDYLPIFSTYGKKYITIRHCLSHQTGVDAPGGIMGGILERRKYETLEDEVNAFASKHEIETNPGQLFRYSNIGLDIAGRVCEVIARKTFNQLMAERILRPCGMKGTSFESEKAVSPSGGAISTGADYMNFLAMLLNKGMYNGKQVLSEAAIAEMHTNQVPQTVKMVSPEVAKGFQYGLGAWIQTSDDKGIATVVSSPGLFGTWPYIDYCRGYACIFFVKNILGEGKRMMYMRLKESIDSIIGGTCR